MVTHLWKELNIGFYIILSWTFDLYYVIYSELQRAGILATLDTKNISKIIQIEEHSVKPTSNIAQFIRKLS